MHQQKIQTMLAIFILFAVPIFIFKEYRTYNKRKEKENTFVESLIPNEYTKKTEKSFVFILFSKEDFHKEQLASIFSQNYPEFRVVYLYLDQQSRAFKDAVSWVSQECLGGKVSFVQRLAHEEELSCFYSVLQTCLDEEIVIHLDYGDLLSNQTVLSTLNQTYLDPDVWLAYADHATKNTHSLKIHVSKYQKDFIGIKTPWMKSHIKTYYAGLLKQVTPPLNELKEVYSSREEKVLMPSLLEIGRWHVKFIPEALTTQKSH